MARGSRGKRGHENPGKAINAWFWNHLEIIVVFEAALGAHMIFGNWLDIRSMMRCIDDGAGFGVLSWVGGTFYRV